MTNTVLIKRSGVANSVPVAGNLSLGELAINYNDGNLFYKNSGGAVTVIASNKFVSVTGNVTGGNINTVGVVSATGNVTGNYFIGNGSQLTGISSGTLTSTVNNFTGNGGSAFGLTVTPSTVNLTFVNIDGVEQIRSTYTLAGNVITFSSAPASGASIEITTLSGAVVASPSSISNGSSNVTVVSSGGNVSVGVGGTGNVAVFATTGEYVTGVVSATGNVTGNYILGNGAFLSGVITSVANINNGTSNVTVVSSGGNITVGVGGTSNVVVFATTGEYVTGVVSATGNITGGNISTAGNLTFSSTGQRILGDLSNATPASRLAFQTSVANSSTNLHLLPNGTSTTSAITLESDSAATTGSFGQINTIGASDVRIISGIRGAGTYLPMTFQTGGSNRVLIDTSGIVSVTGSVSVAGNVTANNGMFTNIVNVASYTGGLVSVTGNVNGGNLITAALVQGATVSSSGNVVTVGVAASGNISATGNVQGGNFVGAVAATTVSASGNVTGGNLITAALVQGATVSSSGNVVTVGVAASGNISATGNVQGGNGVFTNSVTGTVISVTGSSYLSTSSGNVGIGTSSPAFKLEAQTAITVGLNGTNLANNSAVGSAFTYSDPGTVAAGDGKAIAIGMSGRAKAYIAAVHNGTSKDAIDLAFWTTNGGVAAEAVRINNIGTLSVVGAVSAGGNITGGNLITAALVQGATVSSSGNVVVVGVAASGNISATGNVQGGNGVFTTIVSAASHTGGLVSVTGNVNGGNLISAALVQGATVSSSGNVVTVGVAASGNISATGNVQGGNGVFTNSVTGTVVSATGNITAAGGVFGSGNISTTGNVQGGNFVGAVAATTVSASGNVNGGNLISAALVQGATVSSSGNVVVVGVAASGNISATGNVQGGNGVFTTIVSAASFTGTIVSVTGNITGGNVQGTNIVGTAAVYGGSVASTRASIDTNGNFLSYYLAETTARIQMGRDIGVSGGAGIALGGSSYALWGTNDTAGTNMYWKLATTVSTVTTSPQMTLTSTGLSLTGVMSAAGNITGGNLATAGSVAVGAATSAYRLTVTGAANTIAAYVLPQGALPDNNDNAGLYVLHQGTAGTAFRARTDNALTGSNFAHILVNNVSASIPAFQVSQYGTGYIADFNKSGTSAMRIDNNGRVLVNLTSTDGGQLNVLGTTSTTTRAYVNATLRNSRALGTHYGVISWNGKFVADAWIGQVPGTDALCFGHDAGTTIAETMRLDTNGYLSVTGAITVNSSSQATAIVNGAANATGNIGSSSTYFNRLFAQATTALYADLAEMYRADADYAPGTVLVFGGDQEVTMSTQSHDDRVAGVVSTNPAHIMNAGLSANHAVALALSGRVPVSVVGNIAKGDKIVTSHIPGVARSLDKSQYEPGVVIGKAVENYNSTEIGVIEVVVGRL